MNLTANEMEVLKGINNSEYGNDFGDKVWSWSIAGKITGKALSGVCSSLKQKGLVDNQEDGDESTIWLTELGKKVCIEQGLLGQWTGYVK